MLPSGWNLTRLGKLSDKITSGSRDWAQYYSDAGSKFIRMTNLSRDGIYLNLKDLKFVDVQSDSSDGQRTALQPDDILISITAELGKIGWVDNELGEAFINQHTALIRINQHKAFSKYLAYLLSSHSLNHKINRMNDAGAKAGLNLSTIRTIPIVLPPLPEQKKIAQILSTWDKAINITEQLIANSQQQKKALMQQLLTGKKRLLDDNGVRFGGEWESKRLSQIAEVYQPKTISQAMLADTGYPVYGANGVIGFYKEFNHGTEQIAVTCRGSTCGVVNWTQPKSWITGNAMVINTDKFPFVNKKFLFYVLEASDLSYLISGSGQPQITGNIKTHVVRIPDIEEQQKIASILSSADREIELLQSKLSALKQEKKALMQQLLTGKRRVLVNTKEKADV